MTFPSWLRGLTRGPPTTVNKSRPPALRARCRPSVEPLEDRTLMSYGLGFAFALGSTGIDSGNAVATDAAGNVLVAGSFRSASLDLDPGPGECVLANAGGSDGYAAKYDPAGNLLWGVQVRGTGIGSVIDVDVDGAGNFMIAGLFAGSVEIGVPGWPPVTLTNAGSNEGFLAKLDPQGNALWARTFGTAANPRLSSGITVDAAGNVYATGSEGNRLFVAKYNAAGATVWTQVVSGGTGKILPSGSISGALGEDVAIDANSNVYVAGAYRGKIDFNPDPIKNNFLTSAGRNLNLDAFVLKLNASGAYVWAGSMGGSDADNAREVAVDGTGNVHVFGTFGSNTNDFDPGPGTLNLRGFGSESGGTYVVKLDPNRNLIWGRSLAGNKDMALDAAGNVYTAGAFRGTIDVDPGPGTFNVTASGEADVLVSKLNSSGTFVWAADILRGEPGATNGSSVSIAVDGSGNIYTTGAFRGTVDSDPGAGTYSLTATPDGNANLFSDIFVSKLVPTGSLLGAGSSDPGVLSPDMIAAIDLVLSEQTSTKRKR